MATVTPTINKIQTMTIVPANVNTVKTSGGGAFATSLGATTITEDTNTGELRIQSLFGTTTIDQRLPAISQFPCILLFDTVGFNFRFLTDLSNGVGTNECVVYFINSLS